MKSLNKTATTIAISLVLGAATIAYAQPGQMHGKMEHGAQAGNQHDMKGNMHKGMNHDDENHAKHSEAKGHGEHGSKAAQSLATPEERQQIASANRAEMQKRASEKGITMPEHRGTQGFNRSNEEHKH